MLREAGQIVYKDLEVPLRKKNSPLKKIAPIVIILGIVVFLVKRFLRARK
jgi:hypothetical protein